MKDSHSKELHYEDLDDLEAELQRMHTQEARARRLAEASAEGALAALLKKPGGAQRPPEHVDKEDDKRRR